MAAVAVWWSRGRGEIRVKRRRAPHVHCVECAMSLELPHTSTGDRIVCPSCQTPIVIGERRRQTRRRLRVAADIPRAPAPLRRALRCALAASAVGLVGWYLLEPEPFRAVAIATLEGARESWARVRELMLSR